MTPATEGQAPLHPTVRQVGQISALAVSGLSAVYVLVLAAGLLTLGDPSRPIADPWFTALEVLIIVIMPSMVTLMAVLHAATPAPRHVFSLLSVVFMALTAAITCSIHFTVLFVSRQVDLDECLRSMLAFRWPSVVYVLDIVAWDFFFPLSALAAAEALAGSNRSGQIRLILILSAVLALAGLLGQAFNSMDIRNIGIVGYAVVFPFAAALFVRRFV